MSCRTSIAEPIRRSAVEPARRHGGFPRLATRLLADESGGTSIEYGLIASLTVIVIIGALQNFGAVLTAMWDYIASTIVGKMS